VSPCPCTAWCRPPLPVDVALGVLQPAFPASSTPWPTRCAHEIRRRLSGRAYALLTTAPPFSTRPLVVSRDELAALIGEIESL
jgi:hypothetical protein